MLLDVFMTQTHNLEFVKLFLIKINQLHMMFVGMVRSGAFQIDQISEDTYQKVVMILESY